MSAIPIRIAPHWKMALVRAFGTRYVQLVDGGGFIEYYVWCGRKYITNCHE